MNLEICIESDLWNSINLDKIVDKCVNAVFSKMELKAENIEICFLFANDEEVKLLNKTYRGIDKATNVLSFPANSIETQDDYEEDECNIIILGSVALAYETIENESIDQNKNIEDHISHLIVHSVLHLLGYDHIDSVEAKHMEDLEIQILSTLNVHNPYEVTY